MKSGFIVFFNLCTFIFVYKIYIISSGTVACGGKFGKSIMTMMGPQNRLNQHVLEFKASSGKTYKIISTLYKINEEFITSVNFINETGLIINSWDLFNSYKHAIFNFCITDLKDYIKNELSDTLKLSEKDINILNESYVNIMLNMFCTKQALLEVAKEGNPVDKYENFLFSDKLLNGAEGKQYLTTLMQIFNTADL